MKRVALLIALTALEVIAVIAQKSRAHDHAQSLMITKAIATRPDIIAAIMAANRHDHSMLHALDRLWIREVANGGRGEFVNAFLSTPLSKRLATEARRSRGQLIQVMVMDSAGCLVAADHQTHDYDQSDEPKWQNSVGANSIIPQIEESIKGTRGTTDQISQSVRDAGNKIIGAVTVRWCDTKGGCA
jgi:hypothetical protein